MSRKIYKICVVNNLTECPDEVFAVKPYLDSFDNFKEEIFIRKPELKNQQLKIYYEDADGDKIIIFNALDFSIFQEQNINKIFVVKIAPTKSVQFQDVIVPSMTTSNASNPSSNRLHHSNVICDGCDKEIYGYRYKCLECHDFDLCMECEPKQHNQHLMVRIAVPSDADIFYRSKLGKRFLRHRRSESLCAKDEKIPKHHHPSHHPHHHPHHHGSKRHSLAVPPRGPDGFIEQVCDALQGIKNQNENAQANGTNDENKRKTKNGTTTNARSGSFSFDIGNAKSKSTCVPLKQSIDKLSHLAQNFATMMDPFGAYMETLTNANRTQSSAGASSAGASSTAASMAAASVAAASEAAKSALFAAKEVANAVATAANQSNSDNATDYINSEKENVSNVSNVSTQNDDRMDENTIMVNEASNNVPNKVPSDAIIIDCSEDEDDLHSLVSSLNVNSTDANKAASNDANKNDKRDESIENGKGSPIRDWTFIDSNEIDESAGTSTSNTGAIPKKSTPPSVQNSDNSKNVDYVELSRLLSTHIDAQKTNETIVPTQVDEQTKTDANIENGVEPTATPPPTPLHPDARVNESLTAMMAMGFSNEGGWLTQLLETVDGNISHALDLLQPHK